MVAKKVSRFPKSTFSHSVVLAILVSTGMISNNHRLYGYEPVSEAFLNNPPLKTQLETTSAGIFKKDKSSDTQEPKKENKEAEVHVDTSVINGVSSCVTKILGAEADQRQHLVDVSTLFETLEPLSWKNVDTELSTNSENISTVESEGPQANRKYSIDDPRQGLAFCYRNLSGYPTDETNPGFLGIALVGTGSKSGLSFSNLRSIGAGAAVYSDEDVVFEHLKERLLFDGCESLAGGGAVSGRSIAVNGCHDVTIVSCNTDLDIRYSGEIADFSKGGGAFNAHKVHGESHKSRFSSGEIIFLDNSGSLLIDGNHADKANGGALACGNFVCSVNRGDMHYVGNHALSGGAVSSLKSIDFVGNVGSIEFLDNHALISPQGCTFLGGGALASGERISFLNNGGIHCFKNTSKSSGGALLSRNIRIVENVGNSWFKGNSAEVTGGAISSQNQVEIGQNFGNITFEGNTSKFGGGAIYCLLPDQPYTHSKEPLYGSGDIKIIDNSGSINFESNENLLESQETHSHLGGGALYGAHILISGNIGDITFSKNAAGQFESDSTCIGGGAIFAHEGVKITDNSGAIAFSNNKGKILPLPIVPESSEEESASSTPVESSPVDLGIRGGGAIFAKHIEIEDNAAALSFSDNCMEISDSKIQKEQPLGGGALFGIDRVSLQNNIELAFTNNHVSGENSSGGAILSKVVTISDNGRVQFIRNYSKFLGGAVCALGDTLSIKNNESSVSFIGNRTVTAGGAIASAQGDILISRNLGKIEFKDNLVFGDPYVDNLEEGQVNTTGHHSGGGAVFAKTSVIISENENKVLFSGNSSGCFGGAILTGSLNPESQEPFASKVVSDNTKVVITENIGDVIFSGNSTTASKHHEHNLFGGGAIYTQDLVINKNAGSVAFYNNYAPIGGAVHICEKGTVILEALGGDIVFQGNRTSEDISNGLYFAGKESKLVEISAAGENTVHFSDAIVFEDLTLRKSSVSHEDILDDPTLILNSKAKDDSEVSHSGNIRFACATSKIPQVALLKSGTLILSDKAQLWLCGLKQERGSEILLSAGTVLRIFDPNAKPTEKPESPSATSYYSAYDSGRNSDERTLADISVLGVDLASFVAGDDEITPQPPQIIVPKGTTIGSGSLDLKLVDSAGIGYENHALLNKEADITLLSFRSASAVSDIPDLDRSLEELHVKVSVPTITEDTYGHMGKWSDPQVINGKLMINWKPTSYKLNPEKDGSIVLNTLWGQYGDLRALKQQQLAHNITAQRMELDFSTNIWGSGMGTFSNCATIAKIDGFTHRAGGYALGLDTQLIEDFLIGGSFAQFFGYTDSQSYSSRSDQSGYLGSGYVGIFAGSWLFKGVFIYSDIHNDLNTTYPTLNIGRSKGSWNSRGILADAHVDYRHIVNSRRFISSIVSAVVPFVEAEYVYIDLPTFTEIGSEVRTFAEGHLQNVAIPFGITLEHSYSRGQRSEVNSLSFSYAFDVYRQAPAVLINLPAASYSWEGIGSDLSRKSMKAQFSNDTEWNSYFSTFLGFTYEWREHTVSYDLNGGMRLIF